MRLFAALAPSPEATAHLRLALSAVAAPAEADATGRPVLRWTDPEQWHLTLAFYGDVPDGVWPGLAESLGERIGRLPAPVLRLRGAGSFAERTVWVGASGDSEADGRALAGLVAAAREAGCAVGLPADERVRHRTHLTVARARTVRGADGRRGRSPSARSVVRALAVYVGPAWRGSPVLLVRSRLGEGRAGGPLHEVVASLAPRG